MSEISKFEALERKNAATQDAMRFAIKEKSELMDQIEMKNSIMFEKGKYAQHLE